MEYWYSQGCECWMHVMQSLCQFSKVSLTVVQVKGRKHNTSTEIQKDERRGALQKEQWRRCGVMVVAPVMMPSYLRTRECHGSGKCNANTWWPIVVKSNHPQSHHGGSKERFSPMPSHFQSHQLHVCIKSNDKKSTEILKEIPQLMSHLYDKTCSGHIKRENWAEAIKRKRFVASF